MCYSLQRMIDLKGKYLKSKFKDILIQYNDKGIIKIVLTNDRLNMSAHEIITAA